MAARSIPPGGPPDEIGRAVREMGGGIPILGQAPQKPPESKYICPVCKDIPPVVVNPNQGIPPGFPEAHMTQIAGEAAPTFQCIKCMIRFMRKYVPVLVLRDEFEAVPVAEIEEDAPTDPQA